MRRLRVAWLPDGKRLHLRNGAIDLVIQAFGRPLAVGQAHEAGIERARALVDELELDVPRLQDGLAPLREAGQRAAAACAAVPGAPGALTAMCGAVADEVMAAMVQSGEIEAGFVNNRGMIAFHLTEGHSLTPVGMDWPAYARQEGKMKLTVAARSRGLAAAGWRFEHYALGWVERIFTSAASAAVAQAGLSAISAAMRPAGAQTVQPEGEAVHVLGWRPACAPRALSEAEAAEVVARGYEAAAALVAAGTIVLAVAEAGSKNFLVGPPQFSLKSLLSLEANA